MQEEVPLLVARSEIFKEMKPVVKYIELVQFQGGFIAGHYEIVFKVTLKGGIRYFQFITFLLSATAL